MHVKERYNIESKIFNTNLFGFVAFKLSISRYFVLMMTLLSWQQSQRERERYTKRARQQESLEPFKSRVTLRLNSSAATEQPHLTHATSAFSRRVLLESVMLISVVLHLNANWKPLQRRWTFLENVYFLRDILSTLSTHPFVWLNISWNSSSWSQYWLCHSMRVSDW